MDAAKLSTPSPEPSQTLGLNTGANTKFEARKISSQFGSAVSSQVSSKTLGGIPTTTSQFGFEASDKAASGTPKATVQFGFEVSRKPFCEMPVVTWRVQPPIDTHNEQPPLVMTGRKYFAQVGANLELRQGSQ